MPRILLAAICLPYAICWPGAYNGLSAPSSANESFHSHDNRLLGHQQYHASTACQEFREDRQKSSSGWLRADCMDIWEHWAHSLKNKITRRNDNWQFFFAISDRLRQQGTPCYVAPPSSVDGAGSRVMRQFAALAFADEMGCNCLLPKKTRKGASDDGTLYCHHSRHIAARDYRCAQIDWMDFFGLPEHTVPLPNDGRSTKTIKVRPVSELQKATDRYLHNGGFDNPPWIHWILPSGHSVDSEYFTEPDTWNAAKLQRVRELVKRLRAGYWLNDSRPSSPGEDGCSFEPSRLNIAIHVRLGDRARRQSPDSSAADPFDRHKEYYDRLEKFMNTVSAAVVRNGEAPPVFHIFSETSAPCPAAETAAFDEFRRWPVEEDQIEPCMAPPTPHQCWEKRHGAPSCNPDRSGVFLVQDRPLYLHVGLDVENAMSCMIGADALLMGCSTFGQVAGLFSEGIKFFSVGCAGYVTATHYKMIPPVAVAEQGNMWVPVSGSWRNPAIYSERILEVAVSQMIDKRRQDT